MSMLRELLEELREYKKMLETSRTDSERVAYVEKLLGQAADTIEELSAKVTERNMEQSDRRCNTGRLIDADRLKEVIERNFGHTGGADVMRQLIDAAPTVDAESVRHGKWIDNNAGNHDPRDRWVKCSLCGYSTTDRFSKEYKYCPNCGAKIEECENK